MPRLTDLPCRMAIFRSIIVQLEDGEPTSPRSVLLDFLKLSSKFGVRVTLKFYACPHESVNKLRAHEKLLIQFHKGDKVIVSNEVLGHENH